MKTMKTLLLGSASIAILAAAPVVAQDDPFADFEPVTDAEIANPDPGDWLNWRRTSNHQAYSPLDQINRDNVDDLTLVWARAMNEGFQEATPLVHDGIMYLPHPDDYIQALDATNGDLIWEYRRQLPEEGLGLVITRSIAIWEDKIILMTKDNAIIALDATNGQVVWETQIRGVDSGGFQTTGPIIANGMAISGRNCAGQNGPGGPETCFVAAHDLESGEELWRFRTIPGPGDPGDETWGGVPQETRHHVGTWMQPSYDPELGLVYVGTSVTSPYSKFYFANYEDRQDLEDQEFLYQTSTLAIDAETGELVWYQQHIRDHWDLDHPFERILVDTVIAPNADEVTWINPNVTPGEERRVLTGIPGKTGIFYSIDRETGEFLWARETVHQNVIADIDVETGRADMVDEMIPTEIGQQFVVCPAAGGGKDWMAGAYSPLTNAIYYPLQNLCMESLVQDDDIGLTPFRMAPGEVNAGTVQAISVETGEMLWKFETPTGMFSLVTTGGGLVFGGDADRRFYAWDQETGEVLWQTILNSQAGGFPITYAVDGRQYIAIPTGGTLISNAYWNSAYPDREVVTGGNSIFVFALPE